MNRYRAVTCTVACFAFQANAQMLNDPAWVSFKEQFGKTYSTVDEEASRYGIFKKTLEQIYDHNAKQLSYKLGVTKFADHTRQEFSDQLIEPPEFTSDSSKKKFHVPFVPEERATNLEGVTGLPSDVDWVKQGALPAVKNQDHCSVCWAFAATALLESAQQIRKGAVGGDAISLSEQQAVDCVGNGCDSGGWGPHWLDHLTDNQVEVCTEEQYPFQDIPHYKASCQEGSKKCDNGLDAGSVTGKVFVKTETDLMSATYQQPSRICINASSFPSDDGGQLMFALYSGGIIDVPCYGGIDHAVVVVGYGTENGVDYWKVRNSWGAGWGEHGYFRLKRNNGDKGSMCMMTNGGPVYPTLKGAPACPDGYSTEWNYACNSFCECNNPDGSKRHNCNQCCKVTDVCTKSSPVSCPFGYSKTWNYGCQGACGCNNPDGSHKSECDKCCHISPDGICWTAATLQENMTTFTATVTPEPVVV